jgi:hypothetical protein
MRDEKCRWLTPHESQSRMKTQLANAMYKSLWRPKLNEKEEKINPAGT